jgi:hypothetical protein
MIVGPPFAGKGCIAAYDSNGDKVPIEITDAIKCDDEEFY